MSESQNMQKIREAMAEANRVALGSDLEESVDIDFTSADGNIYKGKVFFRRPDMKAYMRMGGLKSEYLRLAGVKDINLVDSLIKLMAHTISTLAVVISRAPGWLLDGKGRLDLEGVKEPELLYHIYGKYEEWENSFRAPVQGTSDGNSQASKSEENVGASEVLREPSTDRPENSSNDTGANGA